MADFGMSISGFLAGATESHLVQHRHVILDDRCFPHHNAGGVVDEYALADTRRRVNIDAEHFGGSAL